MKTRLATLLALAAIGCAVLAASAPSALAAEVRYYPVPAGSHPHDVAAAPDGTVWYTAQGTGHLGILDPKTGRTEHIALGRDSSPHGVIAGPDGAAWITDGGQNAIVRFEADAQQWTSFPGSEPNAQVRQMLGRPGEAWGAESARDRLVVVSDK